ncbi:hypothetical protein BS47DRAFT_1328893 [Hydnum rufescens UP504]|uniref:Large ribosomal subunit protein uL15/eL18 domain-containing protein n=1 Tax=Hydnum rufescens UP504 TaxID=1448309 RepID=A0A9P6AYS2_9AGAM|nr:hypothetical protein BS47DRAFT_1328893 [Hydnum rufescens UP504]
MQALRRLAYIPSRGFLPRQATIPSRYYASVVARDLIEKKPSYKPVVPRTSTTGLSPFPGSRKHQKRLGRGKGSGHGGTSTRGHKGQNARSGNGKPKAGFEGGQTPITRRFPKRGFFNQSTRTWAPLNLDRLQHWINQGRLISSPENPITAHHLYKSRCVHGAHDGIKLLGDGSSQLTSTVHLVVSRASKSAIREVEKLGGSVVCRYYNDLGLKDCLKGRSHRKLADPIRKPDILWYSDSRNRGYLSPLIKGDEPAIKAELESRRLKRRALRPKQPDVTYPVFKLDDMLALPKGVSPPKA